MAGTWRLSLCVAAVSLLAASSASAFNGRCGWWRSAPTSVSYYYVTPATYWVVPYCPPMPRVIPVPDARPTPAPPSSTGEPPLRMPVIVTSHAIGGNFVPGTAPLAKDRCRVGFWNLSGREVTVVIDGKAWKLAKDRAVTLDLERQFAWQVAGQPQTVERVPEGQASHEVVIRE